MGVFQALDAGTNAPLATEVIQGAQLSALIEKSSSTKTKSHICSSGYCQPAELRDVKNIWTELTVGDLISYSGGVIVTFVLADAKTLTLEDEGILRYGTPLTALMIQISPIAISGLLKAATCLPTGQLVRSATLNSDRSHLGTSTGLVVRGDSPFSDRDPSQKPCDGERLLFPVRRGSGCRTPRQATIEPLVAG